ncbi:MAG: hypothetical protein LBR56_03645 [Sporomusaceae bacterium]|jgi:hypothetical protein|nr:hypothetical protein [Sporomusaceae bacterium]
MSAIQWFNAMFRENLSCQNLMEIGKKIAKDEQLTYKQKAVLRKVWMAKYKLCNDRELGLRIE